MTPQVHIGRRIEDIVERESGGLPYVALTVQMLGSELEGTYELFRYDDAPLAQDLAERCRSLIDFLDALALTASGELTQNQECRACGGDGKYAGVDVCEECSGTGIAALEGNE